MVGGVLLEFYMYLGAGFNRYLGNEREVVAGDVSLHAFCKFFGRFHDALLCFWRDVYRRYRCSAVPYVLIQGHLRFPSSSQFNGADVLGIGELRRSGSDESCLSGESRAWYAEV